MADRNCASVCGRSMRATVVRLSCEWTSLSSYVMGGGYYTSAARGNAQCFVAKCGACDRSLRLRPSMRCAAAPMPSADAAQHARGGVAVRLLRVGIRDGGRRRCHPAYAFGPVDRRVAADRRHAAADVGGAMAADVRKVSAHAGVPARQQGNGPRRVQGYLLVGVLASPARTPHRGRLSHPVCFGSSRGARSRRAIPRSFSASSSSAGSRARWVGTW